MVNKLRSIPTPASFLLEPSHFLMSHLFLVFILNSIFLWSISFFATAGNDLSFLDDRFTQSAETSLLVESEAGVELVSKQPDKLLTPASTTKLVTAYLALQHWGENHRFQTHFFVSRKTIQSAAENLPVLVIKGFGDPFLVSEEIQKMAAKVVSLLKKDGISKIQGIQLDTSYYQNNLKLPGSGGSNNPYDAIPSALTANFNSLYIQNINGKLQSAESQTPLTETAKSFAKQLEESKKNKLRVNTGLLSKTGERNFAELFKHFLETAGLQVGGQVEWAKVDSEDILLYKHANSKTLAEIIRPMMKYSTNFIANQLAINLSVEAFSAPATAEKVALFYQQKLHDELHWEQAYLEDGAGLSRHNKMNARHLLAMLELFKPWKYLLPEVAEQIYAKSGSLIGVSNLAGFIVKDEQWLPFVLMMSQKMPYHYRNKVAMQIRDSLQ